MNRKLLLWIFAISGMTAIIYEIVWSRSLQIIFGSTIYSVSTILTTFFAGFSIGSYMFRNIADRYNPLKLLGVFQLIIGMYALIMILLFRFVNVFVSTIESRVVQFALLFVMLIIPTTLFGATWPTINKAYVKEEKVGKDSGALYSFNSLGSAFGPVLAGFILIPLYGIKNTSIIAASINIIVGMIVLIYSRGRKNGR